MFIIINDGFQLAKLQGIVNIIISNVTWIN